MCRTRKTCWTLKSLSRKYKALHLTEDCSVVVWWDIIAAAMHTNAHLIVCLWSFVFVCLWACVLIVCFCAYLLMYIFEYLLVCWLGRLDWFRVKPEASVSYTHQWCVPARRVLAFFLGRGEREKRRAREKRKQGKYGRRSKKREWSLHKKALASLCCIMPTLDNCVENDCSIHARL